MHGGGSGQHQAAGLFEGECRRLGHHAGDRDHDLGGVGALDRVEDDLVTGVDGPGGALCPVAHRGDHPGGLRAQCNRQLTGVVAEGTAVELAVDRVGAHRPDGHRHLTGARRCDRPVDDGECFGAAERSGDNGGRAVGAGHGRCNREALPAIPGRRHDPSAYADLVKTDVLFPNVAARELGNALAAT
jgi:hypothetical protein